MTQECTKPPFYKSGRFWTGFTLGGVVIGSGAWYVGQTYFPRIVRPGAVTQPAPIAAPRDTRDFGEWFYDEVVPSEQGVMQFGKDFADTTNNIKDGVSDAFSNFVNGEQTLSNLELAGLGLIVAAAAYGLGVLRSERSKRYWSGVRSRMTN